MHRPCDPEGHDIEVTKQWTVYGHAAHARVSV